MAIFTCWHCCDSTAVFSYVSNLLAHCNLLKDNVSWQLAVSFANDVYYWWCWKWYSSHRKKEWIGQEAARNTILYSPMRWSARCSHKRKHKERHRKTLYSHVLEGQSLHATRGPHRDRGMGGQGTRLNQPGGERRVRTHGQAPLQGGQGQVHRTCDGFYWCVWMPLGLPRWLSDKESAW